MAAEQKDTAMADAPDADAAAALVLSDDETRVLALYDQLKALRLEIALLKARQSHAGDASSSSSPPSSSPEDVEAAQKQLLEARAAYVLRGEVVDGVLTVSPVLKAVHGATQASPIERDLLPAVEQRDAASQAVAREAAARRAVLDEHAAAAAECREVERQNAQLAAQVRELVAAAAATEQTTAAAADDGDDDDSSAAAELARLEASVKASRQRWKLIKGAASAIVAGSGVVWARDAALRDVVLDPE